MFESKVWIGIIVIESYISIVNEIESLLSDLLSGCLSVLCLFEVFDNLNDESNT